MKITTLLDKVFVSRTYKRLFDSEEGKIVLADILRQGYVFTTTYVPNNPIETAHREGMRRFALSIARRARLGSEAIEKLMDEINDNSVTAKRGNDNG